MTKKRLTDVDLVKRFGGDYHRQRRTFGLNNAEEAIINEWVESLKPEILAIQKGSNLSANMGDIIGDDEPYYGAIGGGLTYSFMPTGLGSIVTVTETITGKTLNVSEALDWYFFG